MSSLYLMCLPPNVVLHRTWRLILSPRVTMNIVSSTRIWWMRGSACPSPTNKLLSRTPSISAEWFLQGKELSLWDQLWLLVSPEDSLCFSLFFSLPNLHIPLAGEEWKVPTTPSLMLVLSLCIVPWTLNLSPQLWPSQSITCWLCFSWGVVAAGWGLLQGADRSSNWATSYTSTQWR